MWARVGRGGRGELGDRYLFGTPMGLFQLEDEGKRTWA
jgi:hypothetical protein